MMQWYTYIICSYLKIAKGNLTYDKMKWNSILRFVVIRTMIRMQYNFYLTTDWYALISYDDSCHVHHNQCFGISPTNDLLVMRRIESCICISHPRFYLWFINNLAKTMKFIHFVSVIYIVFYTTLYFTNRKPTSIYNNFHITSTF